ncbi:MAG: hypothetical protein ABIH39_04550 [Candidatus Margulisiibacteriota bacterium]
MKKAVFSLFLFVFCTGLIYSMELSDICNPNFGIACTNSHTAFSIDEIAETLIGQIVTVNSTTFNNYLLDGTTIIEDTNIAPELLSKVYNYPNPFSIPGGTSIGYKLSKDMDITIKGYNLRGYEAFSIDCPAGDTGGSAGYNRVPFNERISPGVYVYLIIHEGDVLGKSKMLGRP